MREACVRSHRSQRRAKPGPGSFLQEVTLPVGGDTVLTGTGGNPPGWEDEGERMYQAEGPQDSRIKADTAQAG